MLAPRRQPTPETSTLQHDLRQMIKACVRSGYRWKETEQWILGDLLRVVNRFGRLPSCQYKMLMIFAKKCGVGGEKR